MKKNVFILNIILAALVLVGDAFYMAYGSLWIKSLTSSLFVIMGLINLIYVLKVNAPNKKFSIFMAIGLFVAMLGDIVLEIFFIGGAALFAAGHVLYFVSYTFLNKIQPKDFLYGAIIFVPSVLFILLAPIFDFGGVVMQLVCVIYAIIISIMVGKAISNYIAQKNLVTLLLLIGSSLFFFSDLMLLLNVFANLPRVVGVLCLITYYPAQCILANTIFWTARVEKNK